MKTALSIRHVILSFTLFIFAACSAFEAKDIDGNRPDAVVRLFVEAVRNKDYSSAARYWRAGDISNIEENWKMSFEEFCRSQIECDSYVLKHRGRDNGLLSIYFQGLKGGEPIGMALFVESIDGRWRLRMDNFFKPEKN